MFSIRKTTIFIFGFISVFVTLLNQKLSLLYFHDEIVPLSQGFIKTYLTLWFENNLGGASAGGIPKLFSFAWFYLFVDHPEIVLFFIISLGTFFALLFSYKLFNFWFGQVDRASILGAILYICNPFIIFYVWRTNNFITRFWFFAFLPLNLLFLERFLKSRKISDFFVFVLSLTLLLPSFSHPAFFLMYLVLVGIIYFYRVVCVPSSSTLSNFKKDIVAAILIAVAIFAINSNWIFPRAFTLSDELEFASSIGLSSSLINYSNNLNFFGVMIGADLPPLHEGKVWYDWQTGVSFKLILSAAFLIFIVSLTPLFVRKRPGFYFPAALVTFTSIFLAWGTNSSSLILSTFERFPILYAFRDPGKWFSLMILPYSFMFAAGIKVLSEILHRYKQSFSLYVFIAGSLFIGVLGWPLFSGVAVRDATLDFPGTRIEIPSEYREVIPKLDKVGRILALPLVGNHFISNWSVGSYKGVYILRSLTGYSFLTKANPKDVPIIDTFLENFLKTGKADPSVGVTQIIFHHDFKTNAKGNQQVRALEANINKLSLPILEQNEYFTLYEIPYAEGSLKNVLIINKLYLGVPSPFSAFKYSSNFYVSEIDVIDKSTFPLSVFQPIFSDIVNVSRKSVFSKMYIDSEIQSVSRFFVVDNEKTLTSKRTSLLVNGGKISESVSNSSTVQVSLNAGANIFEYVDSQSEYQNVLRNGSFEDGPWNKHVGDCNNYDSNPLISASLDTIDKVDGTQSLQLEATRHNACNYIVVVADQNHGYLLSFDYQSPNSDHASYYVGFNDSAKTVIRDNLSIEDKTWHNFSKAVYVPEGATEMKIYLYARETDGTTNIINRYDNVKLTKIPDLRDAFYLVSESERPALVEPQSVTFDLINPTKKLVHIKGATTPFFLAMSESYHDQWQLQFNNGKIQGFLEKWWPFVRPDRVSDEYHYKLNDFLNAWYVDVDEYCKTQTLCVQNEDGSYDIEMTIEFFPQRWFYLGLLISGTTLVGCLGYLGREGYRHIRKKKHVA